MILLSSWLSSWTWTRLSIWSIGLVILFLTDEIEALSQKWEWTLSLNVFDCCNRITHCLAWHDYSWTSFYVYFCGSSFFWLEIIGYLMGFCCISFLSDEDVILFFGSWCMLHIVCSKEKKWMSFVHCISFHLFKPCSFFMDLLYGF